MRSPSCFIAIVALLGACGSEAADDGSRGSPAAPAATPANPQPANTPSVAAIPGGAVSKDELRRSVCYFTPAEIEAALGFSVSAGKPELSMADYGSFSCRYEGRDNVLVLNVLWVDPANVGPARANQGYANAGNLDRLPSDPDGAYLQYQQEMGGALHYMRRNVMVEVRPMTWRIPNEEMKARLLRLRRVP